MKLKIYYYMYYIILLLYFTEDFENSYFKNMNVLRADLLFQSSALKRNEKKANVEIPPTITLKASVSAHAARAVSSRRRSSQL